MKNEQRIVELLAEMLHKFDVLAERVDRVTDRVDKLTLTVEQRLMKVETSLDKVQGEIVKLNLISSENSRALLKLADTNDRIVRLEKAVFK